MNKSIIAVIGTLMLVVQISAQRINITQVPSFPGAEGHGRYTPGGRGGKVIHVTNLNDDGVGSLRAAVSGDEPKIVVFDVGGVIALESDLFIGENTTIAGQTAPYPGITVRHFMVIPNSNNVIRFIRSRCGDERRDGDWDWEDASEVVEKTALILDHCSFSWGTDETASFYDNNNFTMQWCSVSEALHNAGHSKGNHGFGGLWGGNLASFHHNMLAHSRARTPRICGARYQWDGYTDNLLYDVYKWENYVQSINIDFRNCLVYNWGDLGCYGGSGGGYVNIVNNYFKAGPATEERTRLIRISPDPVEWGVADDMIGLTCKFYINGNYMTEGGKDAAFYDWKGVHYKDLYEIDGEMYCMDYSNWYGDQFEHKLNSEGVPCVRIKLDEPAPIGEVTTHKAEIAFEKVLDFVGASLYRDEVDERHVNEARNGTATYTGSVTGKPGLIDAVSDVKGYNEHTFPKGERPSDFDTDRDGIPNAWERANGLNPYNPNDAQRYTIDPKGWYSNIEVYLNSLVQDIMQKGNADAESTINEYYPPYVTPSEADEHEKEDMEEKVVYAIANGESFTSGTTIERPNITLTFGETGGPDFLPANHYPLNHIFQNLLPGNEVNGNKPGGTFYVFSPQKDGILTIAVRQNRIKKLYIEENGTPLPEFNGVTLDESHSLEYMFTLPVKAGASYKLYCEGSKLGFYGFIFLSRVGLMCDVNGDGEVNVADIVCLIRIMMYPSFSDKTFADLNGDGVVDEKDIEEIVKIVI